MAMPNKRRAAFYFDKETGLLARRVVTTETPIGVDSEQTDSRIIAKSTASKSLTRSGLRTSTILFVHAQVHRDKNNAQVDEAQFKMPESK